MSFTCTLFSDKGRCFNQSERALYGNFIINMDKNLEIIVFPKFKSNSYHRPTNTPYFKLCYNLNCVKKKSGIQRDLIPDFFQASSFQLLIGEFTAMTTLHFRLSSALKDVRANFPKLIFSLKLVPL